MDRNANTYSLQKVIKHYVGYSTKLQKPEQTIYNILKPELNQMKMLDIGVGGGRTTHHFASKVKEYIGIDFSEGMITACQNGFHQSIPLAKFEVCDVRNLSRFETHYFDFVLFSFNGLDNITHEERIASLKEIRRICKPKGFFCFSSHNLLCLPSFFKPRFRLHPIKFVKSLFNIKKLREQNSHVINSLDTADFVNVYDDVYDFGLNTYYVRPSYQVTQLNINGFNSVRLFSLESGEELKLPAQWNNATDSWIYYLCEKH